MSFASCYSKVIAMHAALMMSVVRTALSISEQANQQRRATVTEQEVKPESNEQDSARITEMQAEVHDQIKAADSDPGNKTNSLRVLVRGWQGDEDAEYIRDMRVSRYDGHRSTWRAYYYELMHDKYQTAIVWYYRMREDGCGLFKPVIPRDRVKTASPFPDTV